MRFLRMLTNSLLAGALGAAYLTVLVLQLNPQCRCISTTTWRWFPTLGAFYGVHLAVVFYVADRRARVLQRWTCCRRAGRACACSRGSRGVASARRGADVAERPRLRAGARREARAAHDGRERSPRPRRRSCCWRSRSRTIRSGAAAAASARALFALAVVASLAAAARARGPGSVAVRARLTGCRSAAPPPWPRAPRDVDLLLDGASLEFICRASPRGGCRISRAARSAARRSTSPRSVRRSRIRSGRPSRPGMYPPKNGVRSARCTPAGRRSWSICCPIIAFRTRSSVSASSASATSAGVDARGRSGASSADAGVSVRHRPLAADVSGAAARGVSRQRSVPPVGRIDRRDSTIGWPIRPDASVDARWTSRGRDVVPADVGRSAAGAGGGRAARDRLLRAASANAEARSGIAPRSALAYEASTTSATTYLRRQPRSVRRRAEAKSAPARARSLDATTRHRRRDRRRLAVLGRGDLLLVVAGFGMQPVSIRQAAARRACWRRDSAARTSARRTGS